MFIGSKHLQVRPLNPDEHNRIPLILVWEPSAVFTTRQRALPVIDGVVTRLSSGITLQDDSTLAAIFEILPQMAAELNQLLRQYVTLRPRYPMA